MLTSPRGAGRTSRRLTIGVLGFLAFALLASGCTVAATWTPQAVEPSLPASPDYYGLEDVACPEVGACVAVATRTSALTEQVVLRQDGTGWRVLRLPAPLGRLEEVSCQGVDDCLVSSSPVDFHVGTGGVEIVPPTPGVAPYPPVGPLACVTTACLQTYESATSWWDGTAWSPPAPLPDGLLLERLVSCSSETSCVLVGNEVGLEALPTPGSVDTTVWNGSSWSAPVAHPEETRVLDLACAPTSSCFASAGVREDGWTIFFPDLPPPELLEWTGSAWAPVTLSFPGPAPTEPPSLDCASARSCTALWVAGRSDPVSPSYLGRWDGTSWTVTSTTAAATSLEHACAADSCVAISPRTSEQLDGTTWSSMTIPSGSSPSEHLANVSCASASTCLAVGDSYQRDDAGTLVDEVGVTRRLSGSTWVAGPPASETGFQDHVSCGGDASCVWADGSYAADAIISRHWNGTAWQDIATVADPTISRVTGLSCPASDWCLLTTDTTTGGVGDVAWVWTGGTSWTALGELPIALVDAVSCNAPGECAVASDLREPVVYRLEGSTWTALPLPGLDVASALLRDLDCTSDGECVAVGTTGDPWRGLLAVRRNGTWTVTQGPGPQYTDVSCSSSDECVAVGSSGVSGRPAVQRWDGTAWRPVQPPPGMSSVTDISCGAPGTCQVTGRFVDEPTRAVVARLDLDDE